MIEFVSILVLMEEALRPMVFWILLIRITVSILVLMEEALRLSEDGRVIVYRVLFQSLF